MVISDLMRCWSNCRESLGRCRESLSKSNLRSRLQTQTQCQIRNCRKPKCCAIPKYQKIIVLVLILFNLIIGCIFYIHWCKAIEPYPYCGVKFVIDEKYHESISGHLQDNTGNVNSTKMFMSCYNNAPCRNLKSGQVYFVCTDMVSKVINYSSHYSFIEFAFPVYLIFFPQIFIVGGVVGELLGRYEKMFGRYGK